MEKVACSCSCCNNQLLALLSALTLYYSLQLQANLRIRTTRGRECVHVLQIFFAFSVFCFLFFLFAMQYCINMRQPFWGTAERIFMKLLPNDRGDEVSNAVPKWGLGPQIFWGAKN